MMNALALALSSAMPATFYVSPSGSDAASGARSAPLKSPSVALERARAGDRIVLRGGDYRLSDFLRITQKGGPGAWTIIEAEKNERPVLDFAQVKPSSWTDAGAVGFHEAAYVRLKGIEVRNSHSSAIMVNKGCRFIDIVECRTNGSFAPGIGAWNSEDVRIVGNVVTRANDPAYRLWGDPRQECPHEAISIAGIKRFEAAWNTVHDSIKEGIDVKEVSANGSVHHNYVRNLHRQALYVDAWFGRLHDVSFVSNIAHDCQWGMVISVEGRGSKLENIKVAHNILFRHIGSGIYFGTWGTNGPRENIEILNNTVVDCGRRRHWAGATGSIDLRASNMHKVKVERNLLVNGGAYQIALFKEGFENPALRTERQIVVAGNRKDRAVEFRPEPSIYGEVFPHDGERMTLGFPGFAAGRDFRPRAPIPEGAFPNGAQVLPSVASPLKGFPAYRPQLGEFPQFVQAAWGLSGP